MHKLGRKCLSALLCAAMMLSFLPPVAAEAADNMGAVQQSAAASGNWTDEGNYDISWYDDSKTEFTLENTAQLAGLAVLTDPNDSDKGKKNFEGKTVKLKENTIYDLSGHLWEPICSFRGTLEGNGATIKGMTITDESVAISSNPVGFISMLQGGEVRNLHLTEADIRIGNSETTSDTKIDIGGIAGESGSMSVTDDRKEPAKVSNCSFSGVIDVSQQIDWEHGIGGVVGSSEDDSSVDGCQSNGTISSAQGYGGLGGIVGANSDGAVVNNCVNNAALNSAKQSNQGGAGGIVGRLFNGSINACTNNGTISVTGQGSIGGIVGMVYSGMDNHIQDSRNEADVAANGESVTDGLIRGGGILGAIAPTSLDTSCWVTMNNCHNTGKVSVTELRESYSGGLVGTASVITITNCSNSGDVEATGQYVYSGGFVANLANKATVANSYNCGAVTITPGIDTGKGTLGGLVGRFMRPQTTIENCYNVGALKNTAEAPELYVGGLVGQVSAPSGDGLSLTLKQCYQVGAVSGAEAGGIIGNRDTDVEVKETLENVHYIEGYGTGDYAVSVNDATDNDTWQNNLGLETSVWEKEENNGLTGYLPVLINNKQTPSPSITRTGKADQAPLVISGGPENHTIYAGSEEAAQGFTLTASGGSTNQPVQWAVVKGSDIATIDENGQVRLLDDKIGEVNITATMAGNEVYNDVVANYTLRVVAEDITQISITGLEAPVTGGVPVQNVGVPDGAHYDLMVPANEVIGGIDGWKDVDGEDGVATQRMASAKAGNTVRWFVGESPDEVVFEGDAFEAGQTYTAVMRVQADSGYAYADVDAMTLKLDGIRADVYTASVRQDTQYPDNLDIKVVFKPNNHTHSWAAEWSGDATHHWHACQNEGCPLTSSGMPDYAMHSDNDGNAICDVCQLAIGYVVTFDANGGSCEVVSMHTDLSGKIASLPTATRSGYTFTGWYTAADGGDKVTVETVFDTNTTLYAHWEKESTGGGGWDEPSYPPIIEKTEGGDVDVSPRYPEKGDEVTITPNPDEGFEVDEIIVTDKDGDPVDVTDNGDGTYTFEQPRGRVTITVTFTKEKPVLDEPFTDVDKNDWFYEPVCWVFNEGLMTGTSETTFSPNLTTSRAMIVSILHRLEGGPVVAGGAFSDVADGAWYAEAANWAASVGVVNGYEDGTFRPDAPITREQMASILMNYAVYKGEDTSARVDLNGYADANAVSSWAEESVQWAVAEGIISGMTADTLAPQGVATRAQTAAMFERILNV